MTECIVAGLEFLSTLSLRRATTYPTLFPPIRTQFLSTLSLRRATHWQTGQSRTRQFLSTPSLRRATMLPPSASTISPISIHALLAESDIFVVVYMYCFTNFYPRSPCGERPQRAFLHRAPVQISIHALLAESDSSTWQVARRCRKFLSTLSLRRATALFAM